MRNFYKIFKLSQVSPSLQSLLQLYKNSRAEDGDLLSDLYSYTDTKLDVLFILKDYGIQFWYARNGYMPLYIMFKYNGDNYITSAGQPPRTTENFVSRLSGDLAWKLLGMPHLSDIWNLIGTNSYIFHATRQLNVLSILKDGLSPQSKTRGLHNRSIGNAIFASFDINAIAPYGPHIFRINIGQMKKDGYMPRLLQLTDVSLNKYTSSVAHLLGVLYYPDSSDQGDESTVIIHGPVPAKYLTLVK